MTRRQLDGLMGSVLREINLASTTRAAQLERTSHGKPSTVEPTYESAPARKLRFDYGRAESDTERRKVIKDAIEELRQLRYARHPHQDKQRLEERLKIGRDRRPASVLAWVYDISLRRVHELRAEARRHDSLGPQARRIMIGRDARPAEEIAEHYGVSVRTVHRWRAEARLNDLDLGYPDTDSGWRTAPSRGEAA